MSKIWLHMWHWRSTCMFKRQGYFYYAKSTKKWHVSPWQQVRVQVWNKKWLSHTFLDCFYVCAYIVKSGKTYSGHLHRSSDTEVHINSLLRVHDLQIAVPLKEWRSTKFSAVWLPVLRSLCSPPGDSMWRRASAASKVLSKHTISWPDISTEKRSREKNVSTHTRETRPTIL